MMVFGPMLSTVSYSPVEKIFSNRGDCQILNALYIPHSQFKAGFCVVEGKDKTRPELVWTMKATQIGANRSGEP